MAKFKRILLKLSGESLMGEKKYGIDEKRLGEYAQQIKEIHEMGVQIGIVIGGGNIFRGLSGAGKGFDRVKGDQMGMLATVINSLGLSSALVAAGVKARVLTAIRMEPIGEFYTKWKAIEAMENGEVVIMSAGTGNPFFTTDTGSSLRGIEIEADVMLKGTRVDGIYTADPEKDPTATKFDEITYDEMLELATCGANVLHNRSVEMAKKYSVKMEVRSSIHSDVPGTIVKEVCKVEKMLIKGVAMDNDVTRISIIEVPDHPGIAFKIFSALAANKINVDIILQSVGRAGTKDISFTVSTSQKEDALRISEELKSVIGAKEVTFNDNVSKVSIVGAGMLSNPGVAAMMFEALGENNINISMISTSEIKISVLIEQDLAKKAVNAIHDKFDL